MKKSEAHVSSSEEEEVFEEIDPDWLPNSNKKRFIQIYDYKTKIFQNKYVKLVHKLLMICVFIDDLTATKLLCDSFMTNPFARLINGQSPFLLAILKGRISFVKFFLAQNFCYPDSKKKKICLKKLLNKAEKKGYNNGLHLAISKNREEIVNILLEHGLKYNKINYMNWKPFDMSKHKNISKKMKTIYDSVENKEIVACKSLLNPEKIPEKLYGKESVLFNSRNNFNQIQLRNYSQRYRIRLYQESGLQAVIKGPRNLEQCSENQGHYSPSGSAVLQVLFSDQTQSLHCRFGCR